MISQYQQKTIDLINQCLDLGMTQKEVAQQLGFSSPNYVSMLIGKDKDIQSPLALKRIPALVRLCKLNAAQALALVKLRAQCHPKDKTHFDEEILKALIFWTRSLVRVSEARASLGCALEQAKTGVFMPLGVSATAAVTGVQP